MKKKIIGFYILLILFNILDIILDLQWEILTNAYMLTYTRTGKRKVSFFGKSYDYSVIADLIRAITITLNIISIFITIYLLISHYVHEKIRERDLELLQTACPALRLMISEQKKL